MQYSIVKLSEVKENHDYRMSAEFYLQEYINKTNLLKNKNYDTLGSLCNKITDGTHHTPKYTNAGIPFLAIRDIKDNNLNYSTAKIITEEEHSQLIKRCNPEQGDILLSKIGTLGVSTVVPKNYKPFSIFVSIALLKVNDNIQSEYLNIFLSSKYGVMQCERLNKGIAQVDLHLEDIVNIVIPRIGSLEDIISNLYIRYCELKEQAKELYQQAEKLLLEELDLVDFNPKHQLSYVKSFADTQQAGRFDAEYFQPKYDKLINKLEDTKVVLLRDITNDYSTGYPYDSKSYVSEGACVPIVRINNIKNGEIDLSNAVYVSEEYANISVKDMAKTGNILISLSGTIGSAALVGKEIGVCCVNQRITSIKTNDDIKKEYLVLLLNSIIAKMQINRIGVGGVQTNVSPKDVMNIKIPILSKDIQQQISTDIKTSKKLKTKAKHLLEVAKKAVEIAIEESEEKAEEYIKEQTGDIG